MQILINHLTRMQSGYICTAGINLTSGLHVRPVVRATGLPPKLLRTNGGPLAIGAVVELGPTKYVGKPPEMEDCRFNPSKAVHLWDDAPADFWRRLTWVAKPRLLDIFGSELVPRGPHSCATDLGKGKVSLGCLLFFRLLGVEVAAPGKPDQIRLCLTDSGFDLDLGVTDSRLFAGDLLTPDREGCRRIASRLQKAPQLILSVGLTRPFAPTFGRAPLHWLQVNNLHFEEDPFWR